MVRLAWDAAASSMRAVTFQNQSEPQSLGGYTPSLELGDSEPPSHSAARAPANNGASALDEPLNDKDLGSMTLGMPGDVEGDTLPLSSAAFNGDNSEEEGDSDDEDENSLTATFLPTQRQDAVSDSEDDDEDEFGEDDSEVQRGAAAAAEEAAEEERKHAVVIVPEGAELELGAQLTALQELRVQRDADACAHGRADAEIAERIAELEAERAAAQRRWTERREDLGGQEKTMMTALQASRKNLKRSHEEETRILEEKRRRIEANEKMQQQIAAMLGSQCSQG